LIGDEGTQELLRLIVCQLTQNPALREDLIQEAKIHLWTREQEYPGQKPGWYFQSCRFFLQNHLRMGRSVDSWKRSSRGVAMAECDENPETPFEQDPVLDQVSAREIVSKLKKWLTLPEWQVLLCLAEGRTVREVSTRLNISHTSVIRHRQKIAGLALKLGIQPVPHRLSSILRKSKP
jgi:DNA-directed RNA polymerase specialized sigma24 family protein